MQQKYFTEYVFAEAVLIRAARDAFEDFCYSKKAILSKFDILREFVTCENSLRSCCAFKGTMKMSYTALANFIYNLKDSETTSIRVSVSTDKGGKRTFSVEIDLHFNYILDKIHFI